MLGRRLVELRKERKLTQADVAKRINISRSTYAQYELNLRVPEYATLQNLADFFEVALDYLVGRSDIRNPDVKKEENHGAQTVKSPLEIFKEYLEKAPPIDGQEVPKEFAEPVMEYILFLLERDKKKKESQDKNQ